MERERGREEGEGLHSTPGPGFRKKCSEHTLTGPSGRRFSLRKRRSPNRCPKNSGRQKQEREGPLLRMKAQRKSSAHQETNRGFLKGLGVGLGREGSLLWQAWLGPGKELTQEGMCRKENRVANLSCNRNTAQGAGRPRFLSGAQSPVLPS